ncbi:hypothetical protein L1987_15901 [Smallanthus sonchifolius]|uniref:Uncharacterized protein n=1 Tax=Smallanthus sonchifolius TaxID=185202 RepID=A0ACB9J7E5_9ASTR|nr:hypothetical protein L1987_15901 [Smallanthus sonchifolius]
MLKKLVDPASRLIYAGANRLFYVFRKSLPPPSLQRPPGVNEEPQNVPQEERRSGSSANIAAATEISEFEQMLQVKTFTRDASVPSDQDFDFEIFPFSAVNGICSQSEIQRLTSLLQSRTTEFPSDDLMKKHRDVRDNFHAAISTPVVTSKVLEEIASPAELAKSYMGSRQPTKALIQDSKNINHTSGSEDCKQFTGS